MKASPNGGMKVGREEILCLFTTVDTFLKGTDEGDRAAWERQAKTVAEVLADIGWVEALAMTEGQPSMPYSGYTARMSFSTTQPEFRA